MKTIYLAAGLTLAATAQAGDLKTALTETKPLFDLRLRVENVDQDGIVEDAHATTLRARLGLQTGKAWNTSLLIEGEGVVPIQDDYRPDPMVADHTNYPVVADPESYEINRFQLTNTSLPGTTLTLGRQRIALDDQRFVGPVGWRQNEQTFDALRVVNKSVENLVIDATYFNQVNRLFGEDSPQGDYEGDSVLLNVSYQWPVGKLTAFSYLLDFENIPAVPAAVRDSTSTYGLRFGGEQKVGEWKFAYVASYAEQSDYADNPLGFDLDYLFGEVTATFKKVSLGYGMEVLSGDGVKGFTTPLATLHKFNGWADKWGATPVNGLEDRYLTAGFTFKSVTLGAAYHDYQAERLGTDYGDEINLSVAAKIKKVSLLIKYADYSQGDLATVRDTQKVWGQVEFVW